MAGMMRALIWEGDGILALKEVPIPEIRPTEVLIRVSYTGVCATDVEIINGKFPYSPPYILGHEITGKVIETGGNVKELREGDRVVIDPGVPCGECFFCKSSQPEFCANYCELGINENGGWADYVRVPAKSAHKIPIEMSDVSAAIFEPMACPFGAVDNAGLLPGEHVLIYGDGPAALYFTQIAKMMGAGRICVVYKLPERMELLQRFGADDLIPFDGQDAALKEHPSIRDRGGFQLVIDAVGLSDTVKDAVRYASTGGRIILYGFNDSHTDHFPHREIIFKGISIFGRTNSPAVWSRAIECVARNQIVLNPLVERVISPEVAKEILLAGNLNGLKTIICWAD
ncbi:zinc-dependent alcohol dehydrogenase [Paenibacillus rhizophilus]|uniref:Zinc-binding dehydrogenase n=1 Tax=Paenibacillus rhizophilus TaxID=1850366 RepID=A0A3N9PSR8_9BACL|nr:alcohol dehydrogenase catalytic domain-containing protein [Paenibacillus rhizophilus]RQW08286.1 zinc-binding dehydrogenase [Paenibacillus rhizophilus]